MSQDLRVAGDGFLVGKRHTSSSAAAAPRHRARSPKFGAYLSGRLFWLRFHFRRSRFLKGKGSTECLHRAQPRGKETVTGLALLTADNLADLLLGFRREKDKE